MRRRSPASDLSGLEGGGNAVARRLVGETRSAHCHCGSAETRSAIIIATRHADPYGPTDASSRRFRGEPGTRLAFDDARRYNIRPDPNGPVWIGSQGAKTSVRIRRQPVPHDASTWETTLAPTQLCRPNCVTWHAAAAASLAAPPVARPSLPRAPPRRPDSGLRYLPCRSCP